MLPEVQTLCLQYIADEWRKLPSLQLRNEVTIPPPWGVWIRLYDPISCHENWIDDQTHILRQVWFLSEKGLAERDPWAYARFWTVNISMPWAAPGFHPSAGVLGQVHQIGLAAFAHFQETPEKVYIEMQWGNLWGRGYSMIVTPDGCLHVEATLWLS
jgi:hypothetical protein